MDGDELRAELDAPGARELLASAPPAHLAYSGGDGSPWVVPIGFLWTRRTIVVCTAEHAPKAAAIARDPKVAVSIDAGSTSGDARSLLIRGTARVEVVDGVPDEYLAAAGKGLDAAALEQFEQGVRAMYARMARITVTPGWARFYDFGGGRLPRTLQRLAEQR